MQIAILVFEHMAVLDAVGPYEIFSRVPGAETIIVGADAGPVRGAGGDLGLVADASFDDVVSPDVLVVPGWAGSRQDDLLRPGRAQSWIRAVDERTSWTAGVGTGALVLAGAGLLTGRRATTHWLAVDRLAALGASAADGAVVFDGKYVTAAGASGGIDLALMVVDRIAGEGVARAIQLLVAYDPQPPFDSGSVDKAPAEMVSTMRAVGGYFLDGGPAVS
jgi:transcriptional regulator GlxA family with amidase domain